MYQTFPDGKGDVTRLVRLKQPKVSESIEHYMWQGYLENGEVRYPFPEHKNFMFYVLDRAEKEKIKTTTRVMFTKDLNMRNLTMADLIVFCQTLSLLRNLLNGVQLGHRV